MNDARVEGVVRPLRFERATYRLARAPKGVDHHQAVKDKESGETEGGG
jgi:hypothetical protein